VASAESPASVLDASAALALLNDEDGGEVVSDAIADGAAISWHDPLKSVRPL